MDSITTTNPDAIANKPPRAPRVPVAIRAGVHFLLIDGALKQVSRDEYRQHLQRERERAGAIQTGARA